MSTLTVQRVPLSSIHPDPANVRLHDERNLEAIKGSLARFGQQKPIVVDSQGTIRAGNGTYAAAKALGWQDIQVVETDLEGVEAVAYAIADNRTSDLSTFEDEALAKLLVELREQEALPGTGFDDGDLDQLLMELGQDPIEVAQDEVPLPPDEPTTKRGDLWILGRHRLLCGDSAGAGDVDRLLAGAPIHLVNTDPPYNVKVEPRSNNAIAAGLSSFSSTHHQGLDLARHPGKAKPTGQMRAKDRPLQNDFLPEEEFDRLLRAWFGNIARVLLPGRAFYIWGGYANLGNYPSALKECELYFSQAIVWDKLHPVLTRKDFMGAFELCQPAGTMVRTTDGAVPIESLRNGDGVVSFSRHQSRMINVGRGARVRCASRPYRGKMLGVRVGRNTTWCTPGHLWTARLTEQAADYWCVYLMKKGNWWRVGKSKLITTWGFGPKQRLYTEGGEAAWILSVHDSSLDAALTEQIILAEYGIPLVTWSESAAGRRTIADVARLYERLDLERLHQGAMRLLEEHGRYLEYPLLTDKKDHIKVSRRVPVTVRACNLLPGLLAVPLPVDGEMKVHWASVSAVERTSFDGAVYSMDVEKHKHYVADGIVTHNCFYGWKEGAAHQFFGPPNATDLWHVKKVNPQSMIHLTEKAVELAARAINYSSQRGENVLDLFGGSGSTLAACEQTDRNAYLMEIDPAYCDVIVERWQKLAEKEAVLDGDGRTFAGLREERR